MSMNTAYKTYIDDAFDAYPFDDDGQRDTIASWLDWLQNEYRPDRDALHGNTPEPSAYDYARANGEHIAVALDDEDLANFLDEDAYDRMSDKERETLLDYWADELAEVVRGGYADDLNVAFDAANARTGKEHTR